MPSLAHAQELSVWTMGGDQPGWQKWLDAIKANYEKNNPGQSVKITYYDKNALLTALRTSLRAGQGPDVIYTEPDQIEFPDNGYFKPLENLVDWSKIEPWARGAWSRNGHTWGYSVFGLHQRDLLQQEADEGARRHDPGKRARESGAIPRHPEEGEGRRHGADLARHRRPAVHRRLSRRSSRCCASSAPTTTRSCLKASSPTRTRAWSRS